MSILRFPTRGCYYAVILLLFAGGCKKDESPTGLQDNPPTIISFTSNPSSLPTRGDSVLLAWKVNGATNLSIAPGVGNVTPSDSGSRKVFVSTSTTFTLTATNSMGSVNANTQVTVAPPMTVNGFVKDVDGEPISGVTVIIKGKTPSITSAGGAFSISNVIAPYEITLILSTQKTAVVYKGLTRPDPSLLYIGSLTSQMSATISGSVPAAAGKTTLIFFVSGTKSWGITANQTTGIYTINANWRGSTNSYSGTLYFLRWTSNANGLPSQYDAYGSRNLTISSGGSFSGNDFTASDLTDPPEQSISGSITRPSSSYSLTEKDLYINFGNAFVKIAGESGVGLTDNFSYTVPTITGATFGVDAYSRISATPTSRESNYWKMGIAGGTSGVTISLANAPQLNLPAHTGTGIDTTTQFLWAQGGGSGVNLASISPTGAGPIFYIFTASNSTSIPNLSPQGLGLPSGASYSWTIDQYFPISSIDNVASDSFITLINRHAGDLGRCYSEQFIFTTRP